MYGGGMQQSPISPARPGTSFNFNTSLTPRGASGFGVAAPGGGGGGGGGSDFSPGSKNYQTLMAKYNDLQNCYAQLQQAHNALSAQHQEVIAAQAASKASANPRAKAKSKANQLSLIPNPNAPQTTYKQTPGVQKCEFPTLGVVRLDYNYPPSPGDIDCPDSFTYDVYYRVVPGLTFEMCQSGDMTREVQKAFTDAIRSLDKKGVKAITGDCGFMMYFQDLARNYTKKPVFMSALAQLPAVTCGFDSQEKIAIFTANGKSLEPMRPLIKDECGVDPDEERYVFVGCEDVPGFEAVAAGGKVDVEKVTPGMVAKAKQVVQDNPDVKAILMECTELPAYSDALREATGLPVYDAITCCDFFMTGFQDNPNFGKQGWQSSWDGQQESYTFGQNIKDKSMLVSMA